MDMEDLERCLQDATDKGARIKVRCQRILQRGSR